MIYTTSNTWNMINKLCPWRYKSGFLRRVTNDSTPQRCSLAKRSNHSTHKSGISWRDLITQPTKVASREEIKSLNPQKWRLVKRSNHSTHKSGISWRDQITQPTKVASREEIRSLNSTKGHLAKNFNHSMPQLTFQRRSSWEYKNHRHRSANIYLFTSGSVPFKL